MAHEACSDDFARRPHPELALPDVTFRDAYDVTVGRTTLSLSYLGRNHGDCLILMRTEDDYLFAVDLATPGGTPLGQIPDYDLDGYVASLQLIEAMSIRGVIGGHGVPVAHPSAITERRQYVEALMEAVDRALRDGANPYRLTRAVELPDFQYLRNFERNFAANVERVAMYYVMGW